MQADGDGVVKVIRWSPKVALVDELAEAAAGDGDDAVEPDVTLAVVALPVVVVGDASCSDTLPIAMGVPPSVNHRFWSGPETI